MKSTPFEALGGEPGIRALVDRFYDLMETREEAVNIRRLHPESLTGSREKLFLFLVGWTGGPPLYVERFGHPRLRARHLPFSIGARERDEWLWCMNRALDEAEVDQAARRHLRQSFAQLADFMRNREEELGKR